MATEITDMTAGYRYALPRLAHTAGRPGIAAVVVAAVWLVHGLYNKVLHGSTRHLAIVQSIPGLDGIAGERVLTLVGLAEVGLAVWVLSGWRPFLCATAQTAALLSMNATELAFARHLLLWPAGLIPVNLLFLALAWTAAASRSCTLRTRLRRHPIAIDAHLQDCVTLTYALPADVLRRLLPPGLELETSGGYGFIAVALVQTRSLRPAGTPRPLGQDFLLAGYRVFTTFRRPDGRTVRGLRILRSDANRRRMVIGGNLLTHYHYRHCQGRLDTSSDRADRPGRIDVTVCTDDGGGDLDFTADLTTPVLPPGSPFASVREARRFAGPLPFTFDYEAETHSIIAINATRTNWQPSPVAVKVRHLSFFDHPMFAGCTPLLAAAFHVKGVNYRWQRGVRYQLSRSGRSGGMSAQDGSNECGNSQTPSVDRHSAPWELGVGGEKLTRLPSFTGSQLDPGVER